MLLVADSSAKCYTFSRQGWAIVIARECFTICPKSYGTIVNPCFPSTSRHKKMTNLNITRSDLSFRCSFSQPSDHIKKTVVRLSLLHFQLVTSSLRNEIRIWKIDFRMLPSEKEDLGVFFISNLVGHRSAVNVARFSPDGMSSGSS